MSADTCTHGLPEKLAGMVLEAFTLRGSLTDGSITDDLTALHTQLLAARGVTTRLEHLVAELVGFKGRVANVLAARKGELDDSVDQTISKQDSITKHDYVTGRERQAEWSLASVSQLIEVRKAEKLYKDAETALEQCRVLHRGADSVRRDAEVRMRIVGLETRLES